MSNPPKDEDHGKSLERFEKVILALFSETSTYHNEKEKMAHALLIVEFGLIALIPRDWLSHGILEIWGYVAKAAIFAAWLLLHLLLRWQLRNRRWAADFRDGIFYAMTYWVRHPPSREGMLPALSSRPTRVHWFWRYMDFIVPCRKGGLVLTAQTPAPKVLNEKIEEHENRVQHSSATLAEWFVTIGSLLIGAVILVAIVRSII